MQIDHPVEMAHPAVAAGIVRHLRLHEPGGHGDETVDVALLADARVAHHGHDSVERLGGYGIGLVCWCEAWDVALEEQLTARWILEREADEGVEHRLQG